MIRLPHFADFCVSKGKLNELQQIILHLTPQSFDIHQIVSICREHKLFIALCYLYNEACLDYAEPINDMYYKIISMETDINFIISGGYQLILYLKYTINGTTFPLCNILSTPLKAKQHILNILFNDENQYKILRHLLALDLAEILNILKIIFDDKHLFVHQGKKRNSSSSISNSPNVSRRNSINNTSPSSDKNNKSHRSSIDIQNNIDLLDPTIQLKYISKTENKLEFVGSYSAASHQSIPMLCYGSYRELDNQLKGIFYIYIFLICETPFFEILHFILYTYKYNI